MVDFGKSIVDALRQQPFYRGQILSVKHVGGCPAVSESCDALFETGELGHLKGSSMPKLLHTLGMEEIYTGLKGGWRIAFPPTGRYSDDVVLKAPKGLYRETFWQVIALVEALDFGRCSLVVCRNAHHAKSAHAQLVDIINRVDVSYAVNTALLLRSEDYQVFGETFPQIVVTTPTELFALLMRPGTDAIRARLLRALSRLVVPSAEEWPPALAANTAFVMRKLNLECLLVGSPVSGVVTIDPCPNAETFVQELMGRSIRQENVVAGDGVETVPATIAYCSGAMLRDPNDPTRWIREPLAQFAAGKENAFFASDVPVTPIAASRCDSLLAYLAGGDKHSFQSGCELHYVLDVSGSMADALPGVVESVIADLHRKVAKGAIGSGIGGEDHLSLSVFDEETTEVFSSDYGADTLEAFVKAAKAQTIHGGTDIPQALVSALRASIACDKEVIELILFSDGCSPISATTKSSLLSILRENRARGVAIGIVYVALDFEPPHDIVNLVERELGGVVLKVSQAELSATSYGSGVLDDQERSSHVVVLSGERGLPASVIQPYQGRQRQLVFTRDLSTLTENPRQVHSVVVSGRFPSTEEIVTQLSRMGRRRIPVFVLLEAEASSRLATEEQTGLWRAPLAFPENPHSRRRMLQALVDDEMDVFHYRYLVMGDAAYPHLRRYVEGTLKAEEKAAVWRSVMENPPEGFRLFRRNERLVLRRERAADRAAVLDMRTFTDDTIALSGQDVSTIRDRALCALLHHDGARLDDGRSMVQCGAIKDGQIPLGGLARDMVSPIVAVDSMEFVNPAGPATEHRDVERLGRLSKGTVTVSLRVLGLRQYPQGNLDVDPQDHYDPAPHTIRLETRGIKLTPVNAKDPSLLTGLANSLKVAAVALFRYADQTVFVHHRDGAVWLFDLAPGGNGAVDLLYGNRTLLPQLLKIGGRLLLECPCEGGLRGATTQEDVTGASFDNGCPRCVRQAGAVVKDEVPLSKRATLEWLLAHDYLPPGSAQLHIAEKYDEGIQDLRRISGGDMGSRRGCLRLVRRIMRDRLGLELPDRDVATVGWMPADGEMLGQYSTKDNELKILQGLKEWATLDVLAHEFFHNVQHKVDGLFCGEKLGSNASDTPPRKGLLFEEGAAVWAESHVMDTLALRSCLDLANLREGDEYGDGFRLFKWIEENRGGVQAVLHFMQNGSLPGGKGCPDETWRDLLRAAEIA